MFQVSLHCGFSGFMVGSPCSDRSGAALAGSQLALWVGGRLVFMHQPAAASSVLRHWCPITRLDHRGHRIGIPVVGGSEVCGQFLHDQFAIGRI